MGPNAAIQQHVESLAIEDELTKRIHIKMSGCPNSCGQHHLATIGLHGAVMKVEGHQLPAYHIFLGGDYENRFMRLGTQLKVRLPAKRAPQAVERFIEVYQQNRLDGETFIQTFDRIGTRPFEAAVEDLAIPGDFTDDNRAMFIDWGRLELYQMQRGEGECAV